MDNPPHSPQAHRRLLAAIGLVIVGYFALAAAGIPQRATDAKRQAECAPAVDHVGQTPAPPYWTVLPFGLLLLGIAALPVLPATAHWWESNLHRFYVSAALAAATLGYYFFVRDTPLQAEWPALHWTPPAAAGPNFAQARDVFGGAILGEYGPFILLLLSLYAISGGIRMAGELPASPRTNAAFLAVGAVLASFIGTTGAAMLLIRPLLETNRHRRRVVHTVVFFIFIVCNCGGCLLPTGDPPLFMGYLLGVRFFWTLVLWRGVAVCQLPLDRRLLSPRPLLALSPRAGRGPGPGPHARTSFPLPRHLAQRPAPGGHGGLRRAARPGQAAAGHCVASLDLLARGRPLGADRRVAAVGQP